MILAPAILFAMAQRCVPDHVPGPGTIRAEAIKESGGDVWAIHDNRTGESIHAGTLDDYLRIAAERLAAGHRLDLGVMQIDSDNLKWLGLSLADTADPCASMNAGAIVLKSYSGYNTGSLSRGINYALKVNEIARNLRDADNAAPRVASLANISESVEDTGHYDFGKEPGEDDWNRH